MYRSIRVPSDFSERAAAIGHFDGMHRGHRLIAEKLKKTAGSKTTAFINLCDPEESVLTTEGEKAHILESLGVSELFSCAYDQIDVESICLKYGCVQADTELQKSGEGCDKKEIKKLLEQGDIERANALLGYEYMFLGVVVHGKGIGSKAGIPTANLLVPVNKFLPKFGVYIAAAEIDKKLYHGVTNIGLRPSADDSSIPTIETLLLDFDENIYGKTVIIRLHRYLRDIVKFAGMPELKQQIDKDKNAAAEYFAAAKERGKHV